MKWRLVLALVLVSFFPMIGNAVEVLKIATVAPDSSEWIQIARELLKYVETNSNNEVKVTLYTGGIMGDEPDVLRKIQLNQLQGGGFSGLGLGKVVPAVRALELPLLFNNYEEVDYVREKIRPILTKMFSEKGFELVFWAEQGFIYVFTDKKISNLNDFKGVKMWVWAPDNMAHAIFKELSDYLSPVPLGLPEVLTSLQTGIINAFYAPPVAAVSLQWTTKVKYMLNVPFDYGTGALLISKKAYDKLSPASKKALMDGVKIYEPKIISAIRKANQKAIELFPQYGVQLLNVPPEGLEEVRAKVRNVYTKMIGELYTKEFLDLVLKTLEEYRKTH